ncbi:MAG TPA: twin-arginine translocation signal domain-containing protein, partial [Nitrospiria bacterium]|nr:twin-arginine translocation signal domain-containing protein [Nitrospiria bacterium]
MSSKETSRRRFLKGGAALAALTAAGIKTASAQNLNIQPNQRTEYIPEDQVPKSAVLRDPWTGEMMRDSEGNLIVDWTGTPQWKLYQQNIRAV